MVDHPAYLNYSKGLANVHHAKRQNILDNSDRLKHTNSTSDIQERQTLKRCNSGKET